MKVRNGHLPIQKTGQKCSASCARMPLLVLKLVTAALYTTLNIREYCLISFGCLVLLTNQSLAFGWRALIVGMPEDVMQRKTIDRMASFGTF